MNAKLEHFKTVCRHKVEVYKQCKKCGILWQGITHDLSKFSYAEFASSAKFFQGDKSPIEAEKAAVEYSTAWLHHKGHNPHHWEYWTDFSKKDGSVIANRIPYRYVVEMVCDWIGAGKVYNKGNWTKDDPINYYYMVRNGRHFHPRTEELILKFLTTIQIYGLEEFYRMARCESGYTYMMIDYEGLYVP